MGVSETSWIAGLLIVALVVSALGTLTAIGKLSPAGLAAGTTKASVNSVTSISLPTDTVDFGGVDQDSNHSAIVNGTTAPFQVQNDGNVNVDVDISASPLLWTSGLAVGSDYQFKCGDDETSCPVGSQTSMTDLTGVPTLIISDLPFNDTQDEVAAEIGIHVPSDESPGAKSSTVTLTGSEHV